MSITATAYRALGYTVHAICQDCGHDAALDLDGLIARGLGDRNLNEIRFACRICGGRRFGLLVGAGRRKG